MRAFQLAFALAVLIAGAAEAACKCTCVNGAMVPLCASPLDIPPPCIGICPLVTPSIRHRAADPAAARDDAMPAGAGL